jgi:hypothetical protein
MEAGAKVSRQQHKTENRMSNWDQSDVASLRKFISDRPNFREKLLTFVPEAEGNTIESFALAASEKKGAEKIIAAIFRSMTTDVASSEQTPFVDIHNL